MGKSCCGEWTPGQANAEFDEICRGVVCQCTEVENPFVASGRVGPPEENSTNSFVASSATAQKWTHPFVANGSVGPPMQNSTKSPVASSAIARCVQIFWRRMGAWARQYRMRRFLLWRRLPMHRSGQIVLWRVDAWARQCRIRRIVSRRRLPLCRIRQILLWRLDAWARNSSNSLVASSATAQILTNPFVASGAWASRCRILQIILWRRLPMCRNG